jgi:hypothetical protein
LTFAPRSRASRAYACGRCASFRCARPCPCKVRHSSLCSGSGEGGTRRRHGEPSLRSSASPAPSRLPRHTPPLDRHVLP